MLDSEQRSSAGTWWRRVLFGPGADDRIALYEELRALSTAGIGIHETFASVLARAGGARKRALAPIVAAIHEGAEPGLALTAHAESFPPIEAALVRAAERTGRYDRAFAEAGLQAERSRAAVRAALQQLSYPALLIHVALLGPLPMVLGINGRHALAFAFTASLLLLLWICAGVIVTIHVGRSRDARWGRFVCSIPVAGSAIRCAAISRFCAAAASLFDAGIGLPETVESAADCAGNGWLRADAYAAAAAMREGASAGAQLATIGALPSEGASLLDTGDRTGELGSAFARLAQLERDRGDAAFRRTTRLIHGIIFTVVAVGVAWMGYMVFVKPMKDAMDGFK